MDLDTTDPPEDRKWLVLYDEDYDDVMIDGEDSIALLLDAEQAAEVVRLACLIVGSISKEAGDEGEVLQLLVDRLETASDD